MFSTFCSRWQWYLALKPRRELEPKCVPQVFLGLLLAEPVSYWPIAFVRYIKTRIWLWGFLVIFLHFVWFSLCSSLFWELRDNGVLTNLQFWPYGVRVMLEFYYIELGLLFSISQGTDPEVFTKLTRSSVLVSSTKVYSPWGGERILGVAGWEWGEMRLNRVLRIQNLKSKSRRRTARALAIHCQTTNTILLYR